MAVQPRAARVTWIDPGNEAASCIAAPEGASPLLRLPVDPTEEFGTVSSFSVDVDRRDGGDELRSLRCCEFHYLTASLPDDNRRIDLRLVVKLTLVSHGLPHRNSHFRL